VFEFELKRKLSSFEKMKAQYQACRDTKWKGPKVLNPKTKAWHYAKAEAGNVVTWKRCCEDFQLDSRLFQEMKATQTWRVGKGKEQSSRSRLCGVCSVQRYHKLRSRNLVGEQQGHLGWASSHFHIAPVHRRYDNADERCQIGSYRWPTRRRWWAVRDRIEESWGLSLLDGTRHRIDQRRMQVQQDPRLF